MHMDLVHEHTPPAKPKLLCVADDMECVPRVLLHLSFSWIGKKKKPFITFRALGWKKGSGSPPQAIEETASSKKANQTNGTKSYFSDGYWKRSLCVLCSNWHLTKCSRGKDKWKERLKEKVHHVPSGRRRGFSGEQQFWGQELLLEASDLLFHQKALAWCQGVGLVSNSITFCATEAS